MVLLALPVRTGRGPEDHRLDARPVRAVQLGRVSCSVRVVRGTVVVSADPGRPAALAVSCLLDGTAVVQQSDTASVVLAAGEVAMHRAGAPLVVSAPEASELVVMHVPPGELGARLPVLPFVPCPRSGARVAAAVLTDLLSHVLAGPDLSADERAHLGGAALGCVRSALAAGLGGGTGAQGESALFGTLVAWLEEHLTDDDVSCERVAAEHHLSARYVRRIFAAQGTTVGRFVRERRLEQVRATLADPSRSGQTIRSIAREWGFDDASTLSRAFRAQFGRPPGAYREVALGDRHPAEGPLLRTVKQGDR